MARIKTHNLSLHKDLLSVPSSPKSFIAPKVEIRESPIHAYGMFAHEHISRGEVVFIKGGHILRRREVFCTETISSYLPLDDEYFIGATNSIEEKYVKLYINHACEPNCGVRGEITFVAMRDISMGEELTIDYAMVDNEDYAFTCMCKSASCRRQVSGYDWKNPILQARYRGFFARYLADKIQVSL